MSKPNKAPSTPAPVVPVQVVTLKLGKAPRIAGHTATKHGKGGTAGTWDAIAAHMAANKGTITLADLQRICTEQGDTGFARYALGKQRQWLVPVSNK